MTSDYYLKLLFSLTILVAILYGVLYVVKRFNRQRYTGDIHVKDRLVIDNGVSLLVVSVRKKEMLLGVSGKDIKVLQSWVAGVDQD